MNKLAITDGNQSFELYISDIKYLLGDNRQKKYEMIQLLRLFFNPVKSEYREENTLQPKVLVDDQIINLKYSMFFFVNNFFSINEECKLGSKSILSKYFEARLKDASLIDTIYSLELLFNALATEVNEDSIVHTEFNSLSIKQLIKLMNSYYVDKFQKDEYDLSQEELTLLQLKLIEYIQQQNEFVEYYIVLIDVGIISKTIIDMCEKLKNTFILYVTDSYYEKSRIDQVILFEDIILDLGNFDFVYEKIGECKGSILSCEEVDMILKKYLEIKYQKKKSNIIDDIRHFAL